MIIDIYLHSNKERMFNDGKLCGLKGEALELFKFACCEVTLSLDVNPKTGEAHIVAVDGRKVAK